MSGEDNVRHLDVSVPRQTVANLLMAADYQIAPVHPGRPAGNRAARAIYTSYAHNMVGRQNWLRSTRFFSFTSNQNEVRTCKMPIPGPGGHPPRRIPRPVSRDPRGADVQRCHCTPGHARGCRVRTGRDDCANREFLETVHAASGETLPVNIFYVRMPPHPGAIRYFRARGVWLTDEHVPPEMKRCVLR